ncbi:MAG TPA: four helix bundle protein [Terriglobia bacterium]|nr:four helix bundle protein [Terriglobia bacterium]
MNSYEELDVWQKAVALATQLYRATETFPSAERFGLTSQTRRSAVSIPANIAEGWGRGSTKEYIQFLCVARGSLMELETHLMISQGLGYMSKHDYGECRAATQQIGRVLNGLIGALRKRRTKLASPAPEPGSPTPDPRMRKV